MSAVDKQDLNQQSTVQVLEYLN